GRRQADWQKRRGGEREALCCRRRCFHGTEADGKTYRLDAGEGSTARHDARRRGGPQVVLLTDGGVLPGEAPQYCGVSRVTISGSSSSARPPSIRTPAR